MSVKITRDQNGKLSSVSLIIDAEYYRWKREAIQRQIEQLQREMRVTEIYNATLRERIPERVNRTPEGR